MNERILAQEQYEELVLALEANGYARQTQLLDVKDQVKGVYKIERWRSRSGPNFLVTVSDEGRIEIWGDQKVWQDKGPDSSGYGEYFDKMFRGQSTAQNAPAPDVAFEAPENLPPQHRFPGT